MLIHAVRIGYLGSVIVQLSRLQSRAIRFCLRSETICRLLQIAYGDVSSSSIKALTSNWRDPDSHR